MKAKILLLCLCLWAKGAYAQNDFVYGIKTLPGLTIEKINIKTGLMTPILYLPYSYGYANACGTFNQTKKTYIFKINPTGAANDRTFAVKCDTFAVDSSMASATYGKIGYQYNDLDKRLYYYIYDNTAKRNRIEYYDYTTKTTSQSDTIPNLSGIPTGVGAFDNTKKVYYIEANTNAGVLTLFATNMSTGKSTQITVSKNLRSGSLTVNQADGKLYGLFISAANPTKMALGKLDPSTGVHVEIGVIAGLKNYTTGSRAIDPEYGRYFFVGTDTLSDSLRLYTVDINTGAIKGNPSIGKLKPNISGIYDLEYQLTGKTPSGIDKTIEEAVNNLNVYPNPFSNRIHIEYESTSNGNTIIQLFDLTGRQIMNKSITTTEGINNFEIEPQGLRPGAYLLKISNDRGMLSKQIIKM